jgi:5-methylcytosine-specific restriction protein B
MAQIVEARLHERVREDLARRVEEATRKAEFLPRERAEVALAEFRDRFGPDRLAALDGETLLLAMHGRGGEEESLAYWLEFKNDELFPGRRFGSIAGGSAHKFGVYRRDRDGAWVTGTGISPRVIETQEAIARRQRDQLLRGVQFLAQSPIADLADDTYRVLQDALNQAAPELVGTAWAHKYFFLLFSDRFDDYHEPVLQRYHLIRMLQVPPDGSGLKQQDALGRFVCAGRFVEVARRLEIATYQLGFVLNQRNGRKRGYWRVGTTTSKDAGGRDFWPEMLSEGRVAVGYARLEDLSALLSISNALELRRAVREELVRRMYPNDDAASATEKAACTFDANVLLRLARSIQIGDIVVACRGATVRGIGRITGDYEYVSGTEFGHARSIEWLDDDEWQIPGARGFRGQVITDLAGYPDILVETERHLLKPNLKISAGIRRVSSLPRTTPLPPLPEIVARVEAIVRRKGQVILYGPAGDRQNALGPDCGA